MIFILTQLFEKSLNIGGKDMKTNYTVDWPDDNIYLEDLQVEILEFQTTGLH